MSMWLQETRTDDGRVDG